MKIKPEKIYLILVGAGLLTSFVLFCVGLSTKSPELKRIGFICWIVTVAIAFVPLVAALLFITLPGLFKKQGRR